MSMQRQLLDDWLTAKQTARQLKKSERTLGLWHRKGIGPPRSYNGKTPLYRRAAVEEWLLNREQKLKERCE
jgi:hypothetical protein